MPVRSKQQWKYLHYLRGKYKTKSNTPDDKKWIWDGEWFKDVDFDKLPDKKEKKVEDLKRGQILYRAIDSNRKEGLPASHFTTNEKVANKYGKSVEKYIVTKNINIVDLYSTECEPIMELWGSGVSNENIKIRKLVKKLGVDGIDYGLGDEYGIAIFNLSKLKKISYEITRKDILNGVDDNFINHNNYTKDLRDKLGSINLNSSNWKLIDVKGSTLIFEIKSATNPSKMYINKVSVYEEYYWLRDNFKFREYKLKDNPDNQRKLVEDIKSYFDEFLNDGNILCLCNCPAFLYWGYKFIATDLDYVTRKNKENRPPDIRNPERKGTICKHLDVTLNSIIKKDVKNYLVERLAHNFIKALTSRRYKSQHMKSEWWKEYFQYYK